MNWEIRLFSSWTRLWRSLFLGWFVVAHWIWLRVLRRVGWVVFRSSWFRWCTGFIWISTNWEPWPFSRVICPFGWGLRTCCGFIFTFLITIELIFWLLVFIFLVILLVLCSIWIDWLTFISLAHIIWSFMISLSIVTWVLVLSFRFLFIFTCCPLILVIVSFRVF